MGGQTESTPRLVQDAIDNARKATFTTWDRVLMAVLTEESLNETITTLEEGGGWEYVIYLYEYIFMHSSVKNAW